jgi:hypothetical protein
VTRWYVRNPVCQPPAEIHYPPQRIPSGLKFAYHQPFGGDDKQEAAEVGKQINQEGCENGDCHAVAFVAGEIVIGEEG